MRLYSVRESQKIKKLVMIFALKEMKLVNEMSDTWDEWEPDNPMQIMLKMAIDRQTVE